MLGNSDIFDEEELLAIANDGGSSSASCHSSVGSEDDGSCKSARDAPTKTDTVDGSAPIHANEQEKKDAAGDGSSSDDDDSDDDDGGFLEWFQAEKKADEAKTATDHALDASNQDESVETQNEDHGSRTSDAGEAGKKTAIPMHLGESVLRYRESSRGTHAFGVVAIQRESGEHAFNKTSTLHLTFPPENAGRKRQRVGNERMQATLQEIITDDSARGAEKRSCQVKYPSDAGRSSASDMVDCLARYDPQRGCYVLEVVDLLVDNVRPFAEEAQNAEQMSKIASDARDSDDAVQQPSNPAGLFDIRSIAKRADDQIKSLRRKGRAASTKKRTQQQAET